MLTINNTLDGWLKNVEIKGNTYQDPLNLATIKSVGTKLADGRFEIPLLTVGKNRINPNTVTNDIKFNGTLANTTSDTLYCISDFIKVKPNTIYFSNDRGAGGACLYDINKNPVRYIGLTNTTVTTGATECYIKLTILKTKLSTSQFEEGSVGTSYEPHQRHELTILSDEPIEKTDRIVQLSNGIWYKEKNLGTAILDGSQTINYISTSNGYGKFRYDIPGGTIFTELMATIFSSYFNSAEWTTPTKNQIQYGTGLTANLGGIGIAINGISTALDLSNYLKTSPITIKYKLATPIYIPLPDDQQIALRTFATKTNISFLTEIEGTIKADVPKSTSASVNSLTTKVDAIDKDLDRVKRLEDATNSTVITDKDFVNISDTANGYLSDVKLEGRTLVNLFNINTSSTTSITKTTDGYFKLANVNTVYDNLTNRGKINLKPSTRYTIIFDIKTYTLNKVVRVQGGATTSYSETCALTQGVAGMQKFILNTKADLSTIAYDLWLSHDVTDATGDFECRITILEGDHTQNPPSYFTGLKSVGQDVDKIVVSSTKGDGNLFDEQVMLSKLTKANYDIVYKDSKRCFYSNNHALNTGIPLFTKFKENTSYTIKFNYYYEHATISGMYFRIVYTDGTYISAPATTVNSWASVTFTSLSTKTIKHIELSYGTSSSKTWIDLDCVIINVGTTPILYKSIETDKKEILYLDTVDSTWKKPTLRGIWNNGSLVVGDTIEKHSDGKYYYHKRMSATTLNGSESGWEISSGATANTYVARIPIADKKNETLNMISDKFITDAGAWDSSKDYECVCGETATNKLFIKILKTKATDLATFKTYLGTNNIIVVYRLATELVYECTPLDLSSYDSETNYYLESGVLSPRSTIKCQNYIGEIINNLKEQVSVLQNKVYKENITMMTMLLNHEARLIAHSI